MIPLTEVTYSRDTTVAAVRDFYQFLTQMFLDTKLIKEPPEGGWPSITPESMRGLGKTNEVISLLRHLPYIDSPSYDEGPHVLPNCMFADWKARVEEENGFQEGSDASELARMSSEGAGNYEDVPSHVIGLTWDSRDRYSFLLDTELGIIHWVFCDYHVRYDSCRPCIRDCAYDYAPLNEADTFRGDAGTWAIPDFFQVLKEQYQNLSFLPQSSMRVCDAKMAEHPTDAGKNKLIEGIFHQHGWPDLQNYQKDDCMRAIRTALVEHNYHVEDI
ncbi:hypothetical protein NOR_05046 [Metarhizium rileyi]|uniref:Uncharacterized protein n=1 Tax=Metarhizium rileyi (strain RCEF 4871) TaxID=1649241 RepID=A0A167DC79_METRR|nr:hypothetical protein NOR_05046 [Metarhizium rileyi RCEF 4871]